MKTYIVKDIERFWCKVTIAGPNDCWEWIAGKNDYGYGLFSFDCRHMRAHRFSFWIHTGIWPGDLCVCHSCDNKLCVKPEHLFIGTYSDNLNDSYDKGRKIWNYGKKIRHGTESRYSHHACRCDKCKYAHKIYRREQRKNKHTIPEKNNGSSRGS